MPVRRAASPLFTRRLSRLAGMRTSGAAVAAMATGVMFHPAISPRRIMAPLDPARFPA